ncbi:hypothetical protein [Sulfurospirillum sp. 1612]|uniref:hypothetical protein n=1 Tax=Sulfurospirillum sp. 1612 TaxID=3094835 RepID=UPI002F955B4D
MLKQLLLVFIILLFGGCGLKQESIRTYPYKIVVKTKTIRIADAGFLKESQGYQSLQIFTAGTAVLRVELADRACLNGRCTTREDFNTRLFGYAYYKNMMDDILSQRPLYNRKNLVKIDGGFKQQIQSKYYNIFYRVEGRNVYFKDTLNHVLIKLQRI